MQSDITRPAMLFCFRTWLKYSTGNKNLLSERAIFVFLKSLKPI